MIRERNAKALREAGLGNEASELVEIVRKMDFKKPDKAARNRLRDLLVSNPAIQKALGGLQENIIEITIATIAGKDDKLHQDLYEAAYLDILDQFDYQAAPPLERLLIENIGLNWLRYLYFEHKYHVLTQESMTLNQGIYYEKKLTAIHNRYLRAIMALATVRKLAQRTPTLSRAAAATDLRNKLTSGQEYPKILKPGS